MALADFLARDLISGVARLTPSQLFGPWEGGNPSDKRRHARFKPGFYLESDAHPHHEYCYLLKGLCRISFQHRTAELRPGDLLVCPGGSHHAEAISGSGIGYRLVWFILVDTEPWMHVCRYDRSEGYQLEHLIKLTTLSADGEDRLSVLRNLAVKSLRQRPDLEMLREAILSILIELYRQTLKGKESRFDARADLVHKITDFVRTHASRPLMLTDVAKAVQMSPNYLTAFYHSATGVSLGRFIQAERIDRAKRMFRQPGSSVKLVSIELGFSGPSAFSRAFKNVTGVAPKHWILGIGRRSDR